MIENLKISLSQNEGMHYEEVGGGVYKKSNFGRTTELFMNACIQ